MSKVIRQYCSQIFRNCRDEQRFFIVPVASPEAMPIARP